jgi:hypothetical protein
MRGSDSHNNSQQSPRSGNKDYNAGWKIFSNFTERSSGQTRIIIKKPTEAKSELFLKENTEKKG